MVACWLRNRNGNTTKSTFNEAAEEIRNEIKKRYYLKMGNFFVEGLGLSG
jgi:hypothetical protein